MTSSRSERALRIPTEVASCIGSATLACQHQQWSSAVEWAAAAAVLDIQSHRQTFLAGASESMLLCELYEQAFAGAAIARVKTSSPTASTTSKEGDVRAVKLLYVISSIAQGQAASHRLAAMIERHDRSRFDVVIIVTDEFTRRSVRGVINWPDQPTSLIGGELLARLRASGVPIHFVPTTGDYLDGARFAIDAARALQPDVALFIASPACPIQAAMAWAHVAPVQINQNIAVPMPIKGIDAVLYHNALCANDDEATLCSRGIDVLRVSGNGTDLHLAEQAVAIDRRAIGVPEDAVLLATAGNILPMRMLHGSFAADLARFLRDHPSAWWVGIGDGDFASVLAAMEIAGGSAVRSRVVLVGGQRDIRPHLKAADIYLNEYPEGGANTVLESMACGVPVVALNAGRRHTECIAASLVGEAHAINDGGVADYWSLAAKWHDDAQTRRAAGKSQRVRTHERFSYDAICREYEACYHEVLSTKSAMCQ